MLEVPGFFWSGYGNEMATSLLSAASAKMPGVSGDSALAISTRRLDTKVEVSNKRGTTVPVMMLMFNDETFAEKYLADGLRAIGIGLAHFGFVPHFYFYDNSTDATPAILQELSAKFPITLVSEPLPDCVPKGGVRGLRIGATGSERAGTRSWAWLWTASSRRLLLFSWIQTSLRGLGVWSSSFTLP